MTRTVIRIGVTRDPDGNPKSITLRPLEPADVTEAEDARELPCDPLATPFSDLAAVAPGEARPLDNDLVRLVGEQVYQGLTAHPGVAQALERAVNDPAHGTHPIYVVASATDAESLPWEALYHPTGRFLSLDPRWPIARLVSGGPGSINRFFEPPLHLAAVIAAADRDPEEEWKSLHHAVAHCGMPVRMTVYVAQDALHAAASAAVNPGVEVRWVPSTEEVLIDELTELRPHLLHMFCHGSSDFQGFLEVATRAHIDMGEPPLYLSSRHLARLRDVVWLVTLDACEGAMPAAALHSLTYSMVKDGIPAAVGMREVIDSRDANVFCRAFYGKLLPALAARLAPGSQGTLEWAEHLQAARAALCARMPGPTEVTAARQKRWTLPVLYRRSEDLRVQVAVPGKPPGDQRQEFGALQMLRQYRDNLHPDTPPDKRARLDQAITALEAQFP